jgi:hypothetical protein
MNTVVNTLKILCGLACVIEGILTPGLQLFASIVGGYMLGEGIGYFLFEKGAA